MNLFACREVRSPADAIRFRFAGALTCLFLVLAGVGASRHECWRDEMDFWLVARDSPTLPAMLEQTHYEGAPPLWFLLLRPLTLMTHRPEAMQVFTWALAGITVFLFCYFAPFSRLQKSLLISNYYLLFEYGIVCRHYLPGVLFLTAACILFPSARERPWPFALSLVGAAMASIHSLIVAVAMATAFWGSWGIRALWGKKTQNATAGEFPFLPLLTFVTGVGLAVYSMLPRPDSLPSPGAGGWHFGWQPYTLAKVSWAFVSSHFQWPRPQGFFWIPPWDMPFPSFDQNLAFILAPILFGGTVFLLRRHLGSLLFYLVGTLGLASFFYVKYLGSYRHTGFLFLTFLFALWMKKTDGAPRGGGVSVWTNRAAEAVFGVMLALQAFTGLWAIKEDFNKPFSCGKPTAEFLRDHHLDTAFIAVAPDWLGAPLAGYLDRSFYYPQALRYGSFTRWDSQRIDSLHELGFEEFFRRAAQEAKGADMVFALQDSLPEDFMRLHNIEWLTGVNGSLTPGEWYNVYFIPGKTGATGRQSP
jgi:hypothetical protein